MKITKDKPKIDSIECFLEQLLGEVEHFRSDLFLDYGSILNMPEGDVALLLTRKHGSQFYSQNTDNVLDSYECWREDAVGFYFIRRISTYTPLCRQPAVQWECISKERADRLIKLIAKHYRYRFYTAREIHTMLVLQDFAASDLSDIELEELGELAWEGFGSLAQDMDEDTRDKLYNQCLGRVAEERG